jgi:succinoglycan biosynthesis transport protein ExoP
MEIGHTADVNEGRLSDLVTQIRDVVRRRWLTLALVSAAVFGLGVVLILMMTPQYTALARVRIDPSRNPLSNSPQESQQALSPEAIETEVSVIKSTDLARRVVRKLGLVNDAEYTKFMKDELASRAMSPSDRESAVAGRLAGGLSVDREKLTYILDVKFTSRDPIKAAKIANAFAQAYIDTKVGNNVGTASRQAEFFQKRLDALGREVRAADEQVAAYRARAGIRGATAGYAGTTIADQQVAPLSSTLANAESDAAAARSNLAAAQQQIRTGGLDSVSEVLNSTVIADLRRQRAEVLRSQGEVQARYGERHPEAIRVRDQLAGIDAQIREESGRVVASLRATADAAAARAASLRGAIGRLQSEQADSTRTAALADSLEREAAAKRNAYDKMSQMSLESTQAAQNEIAQAEIVDPAQAPVRPSAPNKPLLTALALIIALGAGAGTIATQEMLVSGLRTVDDVETQLGVPVLAAVPKVPRTTNPSNLLLEKPTSLYAESLRIARAAILGVKGGASPHVIAITSALPSEGKTTTALSFARILAANNARTLLIECDVRRAAMRPLVNQPPKGPGLVEVLHGEIKADEAISPGDVPGLDHLLVRSPYFSSEDLFGAGGMEELLNEMRRSYDLIVLDLPPLVGLADGRFLAAQADTVALVVRWDSTPAAAAASALSWLRSDGAHVSGVIYTMVESSAEAIGGLYYSKKYSAYYQQA